MQIMCLELHDLGFNLQSPVIFGTLERSNRRSNTLNLYTRFRSNIVAEFEAVSAFRCHLIRYYSCGIKNAASGRNGICFCVSLAAIIASVAMLV
jgi:hypothetical protein